MTATAFERSRPARSPPSECSLGWYLLHNQPGSALDNCAIVESGSRVRLRFRFRASEQLYSPGSNSPLTGSPLRPSSSC